jgi:DNA-binding IclR family transcriptional regulator
MARSTSGESVLTRAVRILGAFTAASPNLAVAEIARRADLPTATAYRLVNELIALNVLERDGDNRVRVGLLMWEWGSRSPYPQQLRQVAWPTMERLQTQVKHHTMLGILVGTDVLYLERMSDPHAVDNIARVGGRLPMHTVSAGLILLAYAPPDLQEQVIMGPMRRFTHWTITDPAVLRRTLADIRRNGVAVGDQTVIPGVVGLAAPVRGTGGDVVAALSIVFPRDDPQRRALQAALISAARQISVQMADVPHGGRSATQD